MAPRKKSEAVTPAAAPAAAEFDVFAYEGALVQGTLPGVTIPDAPAPEVESPKAAPSAAAPSKKECNEACPKFHRPDPECVECFNKHFQRL